MASIIPLRASDPVEELPPPTSWEDVWRMLGSSAPESRFITITRTSDGCIWLCESSKVRQPGNDRATQWLALRGEPLPCGAPVLYLSAAEAGDASWLYFTTRPAGRKGKDAKLPPGDWSRVRGNILPVKPALEALGLTWEPVTKSWWVPRTQVQRAQSMVDRGFP